MHPTLPAVSSPTTNTTVPLIRTSCRDQVVRLERYAAGELSFAAQISGRRGADSILQGTAQEAALIVSPRTTNPHTIAALLHMTMHRIRPPCVLQSSPTRSWKNGDT